MVQGRREKRRILACALVERLDVDFYAFALLSSGSLELLAFDASRGRVICKAARVKFGLNFKRIARNMMHSEVRTKSLPPGGRGTALAVVGECVIKGDRLL